MIIDQDIVVIGAGIAGAAIAAHLAKHARVRLLEMEAQPGYHSTGRSAALFFQTYGNEHVRALTRASRSFFYSPPEDFCRQPLVRPRPILLAVGAGQESELQALLDSAGPGDGFEVKTPTAAKQLHPVLRTEGLSCAAYTAASAEIDVHELHQAYLRRFQSREGVLSNNARVVRLERIADRWCVTTEHHAFRASLLINAAGAWADALAELAGAARIGLQPLKRSACLIPAPEGHHAENWPMLVDIEETFYLKPEAGALLLSPADETLSPPGDVQPDDLDIAVAVERVEMATTLNVARVTHKWAGLRSFVADRSPVVGFDPLQPGFFWLAALGGYGIQTAPALSRLAASLALKRRPDDDLLEHRISPDALAPRRLTPIAQPDLENN
jgi:D-arginine dehydrogenase